jgi:LuxR family maltose regulon positive regulatory protein
MLRQIQVRGLAMDYVAKLLAAFDEGAPTTPSRQWIGIEVEPLSQRELEVLRLVADGASNSEIAQQLVVSVGTVKRHLNSIFAKLDAHSRTRNIAFSNRIRSAGSGLGQVTDLTRLTHPNTNSV